MASTQTTRYWYPDLVVGGVTDNWTVIGTRPQCDYSPTIRVPFYASDKYNGRVFLRLHPRAAAAGQALAATFLKYGYQFRQSSGGSVSCRKITGGTRTSLHAHGCAIDINPRSNPYINHSGTRPINWDTETDMPEAMVLEAEGIKTVHGGGVWFWGGRFNTIKDAMHWQTSVTHPDSLDLGIDWDTVPGWEAYVKWVTDGTLPPDIPSDEEEEVKVQELILEMQTGMKAAGYYDDDLDGIWGPNTTAGWAELCSDAAEVVDTPFQAKLTGLFEVIE